MRALLFAVWCRVYDLRVAVFPRWSGGTGWILLGFAWTVGALLVVLGLWAAWLPVWARCVFALVGGLLLARAAATLLRLWRVRMGAGFPEGERHAATRRKTDLS